MRILRVSVTLGAAHLSVQAHVPGVDGSCLVVDAKHHLVDGVGGNAFLSDDGVAQVSVLRHGVVGISG